MSRTSAPAPFRIEYHVATGAGISPASWFLRAQGRIPGKGQPNVPNLNRHMQSLTASFEPGGCNDHIGLVTFASARIVAQMSGATVLHWAPDRGAHKL